MKKIAIIGSGSWGVALAIHLHIRHILFHSQRISRILRHFSSPSFSVNTNSRVHFIHCLPNLVHRFNIMHSHQIEAKTIDMIFLHPVKHGFYHKLTHHRTFTSRFISTTRTVRQCPVFFLTIKITGYCIHSSPGKNHYKVR